MNWLIAFLNKTPGELTLGEAGIMLIVCCLSGIVLCVILLKALSPAPNVIRFPQAPPGTKNPFLNDDGSLESGLIQSGSVNSNHD